MKNKLEIYALSVCFAAVVCVIISAAVAGYSAFSVIAPELTMSAYKYDDFKSNDAYWKSKQSCSKEAEKARPPEEELTKQRTEAFAIAISAEKRESFQSLIQCFMFLLVAGITLLIHWKIAKSARTG